MEGLHEVKLGNVQGMESAEWRKLSDATPWLVCVWGGWVANIGEDNLTKWLHDDKRRLNLQTVIYYPSRTKGGAFPRPRYFEGDREGSVEFPACRLIGMSVAATRGWRKERPLLCPADWGWVAPALQHIIVYTEDTPFDLAAFRERVRLCHPGVTKVQLVQASRAVPWPQDQTVLQELE